MSGQAWKTRWKEPSFIFGIFGDKNQNHFSCDASAGAGGRQRSTSVMDLCTDNLTANVLVNKSFGLIGTRWRPQNGYVCALRLMLAAHKNPHLFIGCQIEYGHVYDNNSLTHTAYILSIHTLATRTTDTMNQAKKKTAASHWVSQSKWKTDGWCQITTLLSMHVFVCVSGCKNHT